MRLVLVFIFLIAVIAQGAEEVSTAIAPVDSSIVSESSQSKAKQESEILLNLNDNKKSAAEGGGAMRVFFTLSLLGLIGTGAFYFLRKYSIPKERKHQTQIKVLQQHYLSPKKSLAIVRVAGESILIGVTDHNISMIKSLSLLDDEVPEEAPQNFNKVLGSLDPQKKSDTEADDEFAISGIKDIVSKRLKGMRSFQ